VSSCSILKNSLSAFVTASCGFFASSTSEAFLFHDDLEVSAEWRQQILAHLDTSSALIAIVTENFANSIWANQEVGIAIGKGLSVIPLMFSGSSGLKGFIEMYQGIPVSETNLEQGVRNVIPVIEKGLSSSNRRVYEQLAIVLSRLITRWQIYKGHLPNVKWTPEVLDAVRETLRKESEQLLTLTSNGDEIDFGFKGQVSRIAALVDQFAFFKIDYSASYSQNLARFQDLEQIGDQISYGAQALHGWLKQTGKT